MISENLVAMSELTDHRSKVDSFWEQNPLLIRDFLDQLPEYAQLSSEVAYTVTKSVEALGVPVSSISNRAKTLPSFLEKIDRKHYDDPLKEITDFAGVRIVCYYFDDIEKIAKLLSESFEVIESEDKSEASGVDKFGYSGLHLLVKLGKHAVGARYNDLKEKLCEIQIRTVMQDSWAIVSHHLIYKREQDVPDEIKRNVNSLAGALHAADVAFQAIRENRDKYLRTVSSSIEENSIQEINLNLDSLREYLRGKFPDYEEGKLENLEIILPRVLELGYTSLADIEKLLERTIEAREWIQQNHPSGMTFTNTAIGEFAKAMFITEPDSRGGVSDRMKLAYDTASTLMS